MPAKKQKLSSDENSNPGDLSGDENVRAGEREGGGDGGGGGGVVWRERARSRRARGLAPGARGSAEGRGGRSRAPPGGNSARRDPRVRSGTPGTGMSRESPPGSDRIGSVAAPRGPWSERPGRVWGRDSRFASTCVKVDLRPEL